MYAHILHFNSLQLWTCADLTTSISFSFLQFQMNYGTLAKHWTAWRAVLCAHLTVALKLTKTCVPSNRATAARTSIRYAAIWRNMKATLMWSPKRFHMISHVFTEVAGRRRLLEAVLPPHRQRLTNVVSAYLSAACDRSWINTCNYIWVSCWHVISLQSTISECIRSNIIWFCFSSLFCIRMHAGPPQHSCRKCNFVGHFKFLLAQHMRNVHHCALEAQEGRKHFLVTVYNSQACNRYKKVILHQCYCAFCAKRLFILSQHVTEGIIVLFN